MQSRVPPPPSPHLFATPAQRLFAPNQPLVTVAANARSLGPAPAFTRSGDGFELRIGDAAARFTGDEVRLNASLRIQTARWGRLGRTAAVEARMPGLDGTGLVFVGPGITEWWRPMRDGVEQGWTIDGSPPGDGPLIVDVDASGIAMPNGPDLLLSSPSGAGAWTVSGLRCWDADARALSCSFSSTPTGFRVAVDDARARYPVTIDPLYRDPDLLFEDEGGTFGHLAVGGGDVNGDGYADILVAGAQQAWVYLGAADGQPLLAFSLTGLDMTDAYDAALAFADVNGDGYDDVIAGADAYDEALVFMGPDLALTSRLQSECDGPFGYSVANAGDVNGDGYDDVVVGSPESDPPDDETTNWHGPGCVALYLGSSGGLTGTADGLLRGVEARNNYFGSLVAGLGDVNGDGYDEIGVSSWLDGSVYVFLGSPVLRPDRTSADAWDVGPGVLFGVGPAGDVNRDGFADLVGCGTEGVRVFPGAAFGLGAPVTVPAVVQDGGFGSATSGAGDVNGDGFSDVLVADNQTGAGWGHRPSDQSYLFLGSSAGIGLVPAKTLECTQEGGDLVAAAGDVDGDRLGDVLIGGGGAQGVCLFLGSTLAGPGEPDADTSQDSAPDSAGATDTGTGKSGCGGGGCGEALSGLLVAPLLGARRRRQ